MEDNIIWYNKDGRFYNCSSCSMPNCSSRNTTAKSNCLLDKHEVTLQKLNNKVMIKEDYVSFETAKLLKEKGFKTPVETGYYGDGRICHNIALDFMDYNHEDGYYSRPTIQMAMKWLREVHNIVINIGWEEVFEDKFQWWCIILNYKDGSILRESEYYATYEETAEAAIKYCLEILI